MIIYGELNYRDKLFNLLRNWKLKLEKMVNIDCDN